MNDIKPRNYWTKERCHTEALKFNKKVDFNKNNHSVYMTAYKNKWLNEICTHMITYKSPYRYWTKERCHEIALKYENKQIFKKEYNNLYQKSLINGWLDEICAHMITNKNPRGYWTKEKCHQMALKFKYRKDFYTNYKAAYIIASKNKWLKDICSHMEWRTKPMYYWTKDKCHEVALKCEKRYQFQKEYSRAYRAAYENNWLDEICSHMKILGNIYKRLIYLYEFEDNSIYIGLTCNFDRRNIEHLTKCNSSVYKHILETGLQPKYVELTEYIDVDDACYLEKNYIKKYEKLGFNILNKKEGGGIGGGRTKWTYENCKKESLNYPTKTLFCKKKGRAYRKSKKEGWINEFYPNNSLQ